MRLTALAIALCPAIALAQEASLAIDARVLEMVNLPRESPRITLAANDTIQNLRVTVREGGRPVLSKTIGRLTPGTERVVTWQAQPGVHAYQIEVTGRGSNGAARTTFDASVTVMRPLEIQLRREEVDLATRRMHFSINNPAGRACLAIWDSRRRVLHTTSTDLGGAAPGSRLEVRWPELRAPIARIVLRVFDVSESWAEYEVVPFSVEIPHDDVVFETARWEVRASERPKLDAAFERIVAAIREHGADLMARLYILGHTDTVGSNADNMLLSQRRAMSIALYFKERGVTLPIHARGFGETVPVVRTADNVDEARNRRAQYILAAQAPVEGAWNEVE